MANLSARLDRMEKAHSTSKQFKYSEADWTPEDWEELLMKWTPEVREKRRLTKWPARKLEDYLC